jgi:ubiquinone/menaquinone biosynthesis C-methylase UbiE
MSRVLSKAEVVAVYGGKASFYDVWAKLTESRARQRVVELAAVHDGEAVLEVAVGTGLLFTQLLERNPHGRNDGIDITEPMLLQAREKAARSGATNWTLSLGDAYALPYPDASFDVLCNCYMFDLLPEGDFAQVLGEFHRVLRPHGRLMLANLACEQGVTYRLWDLLYRINPSLVGGCRAVQLTDTLRHVGFAIDVCEQVKQLTLATEVIRARKPDGLSAATD